MPTPRKAQTRHTRNQPSQNHIQPSDYDSEVPFTAPPLRTNPELNLTVLRRYNASIFDIESIAPSAVIYHFNSADANWERAEIEGTLFVCRTVDADIGESFSVFVLNRKGMDNLDVDLAQVSDIENQGEFLIIGLEEQSMVSLEKRLVGIFIHPHLNTREVNFEVINKCWEAIKLKKEAVAALAGENLEGPGLQDSHGTGSNALLNHLLAGQRLQQNS